MLENPIVGYHCFVDSFSNLKNISDIIPYLKKLGVDRLSLTPIFQANTIHKYDTIDYFKIDPQFGSDKCFESLIQECKQNNIKLVLDGVFNHTSNLHPWFDLDDKKKYKKTKNNKIKYWAGVKNLPILDHKHQEVKDYFYETDTGVMQYWLDKGIAGWRIDTAEDLGKRVIKRMTSAVKQTHPESCIVGEVVKTCGSSWLEAGLDGVINYAFRNAVKNFLIPKSSSQGKNSDYAFNGKKMMKELTGMVERFPTQKLHNCWNILSTHDTNRMFYDFKYNEELFFKAVMLQFTFPGIPMIYYGEEIGMKNGKKNVNNRAPMDWDCFDTEQGQRIFKFYQKMIKLRQDNPALVSGDFIPIYADERSISFIRHYENNCVLVSVGQRHCLYRQ